MLAPLFSDAAMARLKRAYYSGVASEDLAERFGISAATIHDTVRRGHAPLVATYGEPLGDDQLAMKHIRRKRIEACNLHFRDLVAAYRPDVIEKHNAILRERKKPKLPDVKSPVNSNVPTSSEPDKKQLILSPSVTRRSMRIFAAALCHFNLTATELTGQCRAANIVLARQVTMYVIYTECLRFESTPSIGRMFNKDHSTVVNAVHKIRKRIEDGNQAIIDHVNALKEVL